MAGTAAAQGYGWPHQQERERWVKYQAEGGDCPLCQAGRSYRCSSDRHGALQCRAPVCLRPTRWIEKGEGWDLGHHPGQRGWRGPEHVRCNRSAGARNSNRGGNPGTSRPKPRRPRRDLIEVSVDVSDL